MKLKVLGSSSSGNCYVIHDENEALIIEAGVSLSRVKQELQFNTSIVSGVLITHQHGDHAGKAKDFESVFNVFTHSEVIKQKSLTRSTEIKSGIAYMIGNFKVLPFDASHDVFCHGYVINHKKFGNMLFLTDSYKCDYSFENINHMFVECNYSEPALKISIENGLNPYVAKRLFTTHMSLNGCKKFLSNQSLEKIVNLVLIHLSSQNSDPVLFQDEISKISGRVAVIAKDGLEIDLSLNPY